MALESSDLRPPASDLRPAASPARTFINARAWITRLIRATVRPRPRVRIWKWADDNIVIPDNGFRPGPLSTARFPIMRGLLDLAQVRGVHYFTLCAGARVFKTLFTVILTLYWISERIGSAAWLDPSKNSAIKFVKDELEDFLLLCKPVRKLAIYPDKRRWTTLWKTFRGKILRIIGSGAEADLHGFNAELLAINELDRCRSQSDSDAASYEKLVARTKLYAPSRLILENSTPGEGGELSAIWRKFLRGSQHFCYVPCPHCSAAAAEKLETRNSKFEIPTWDQVEAGRSPQSYDPTLAGWQRFTFSPETKLVPFDENLNPFPRATHKDKWREEVTGQIRFEQFAIWGERVAPHDATKKERVRIGYDIDAAERGATYQCAHCKKDIEYTKLEWMLARFRWIAHNPLVARDRISAHVWAAYSPFERWGAIAKEFLEAKGDIGALIKFENLVKGLPFIRHGTAIKEDDIDRAVARTPVRYMKGEIPREAEILTMTVDKQGTQFWYGIRARGILWDHPDRPTWSALVDWGEAVSWDQILELAGLKEDAQGKLRRFVWRDPATGKTREYDVTIGLVDSGFEPEDVYEFCLKQSAGCFDPYKGGDLSKTGGAKVRITKVLDGQLDLHWAWSDWFARNLYYDCIKWGTAYGEPLHWWLPANLDDEYKKQLTDEYEGEENGKRKWLTRKKWNHLGDVEKMQRVLDDPVEELLDAIRDMRAAEEEKALNG